MHISSVLQTQLWILPKFEAADVWSQGWEAAKAICREHLYTPPSPGFGSIQMKVFGCGHLSKFSRIRCLPWVLCEIVWSPSHFVTFMESASQVLFFSVQLFFNLAVLNLCNSSIMCPKSWERCEYITEEETKAWCVFPETISMPLHHKKNCKGY